MPGLRDWFFNLLGLGPSPGEKLDFAAQQMLVHLRDKQKLAGRIVAQGRTAQRILNEKVARYRELQSAAVQLQREGKTQATVLIAGQMASLSSQIQTMTADVEKLNTEATDAVTGFLGEKDEVNSLMEQHGMLKARAEMNTEMERLQKDLRALGTGALTARGAYQAIAREIGTKSEEFRALAELEGGDATHQAEINRALQDVRVAGVLKQIETLALSAGDDVIDAEIIDRATAALSADPIRGALPAPRELPPSETSVSSDTPREEGEAETQ